MEKQITVHADDQQLLESTIRRVVSLHGSAMAGFDSRISEIDMAIEKLRKFRAVLVSDQTEMKYALQRTNKLVNGLNLKNLDARQGSASTAVSYFRSMEEKANDANEILRGFYGSLTDKAVEDVEIGFVLEISEDELTESAEDSTFSASMSSQDEDSMEKESAKNVSAEDYKPTNWIEELDETPEIPAAPKPLVYTEINKQ